MYAMRRHSFPFPFPFYRLDLLAVLGLLVATGRAEIVPLLQPGFFFDYNIATQPVPIPITEQCETIHLKWSRQGAIGPNPVAPYSMVVYTSTFITPFTIDVGDGLSFDWQVPFAPGTQYQICMWDSNGVPGGCQAMYTVVQNSTIAEPTCHNVTFPTLLQVDAAQAVPTGPLSQYGFINQCTDILVKPVSGKPPYTLTVAPPLHPPFNLTSNSMDRIDWTVSLPWSYPFFLSLQSADGQLWSFGPLHAGGFGPTDCLAPGTIPTGKARTIALGAGLGSAFGAGILAALGTLLFLRLRPKLTPAKEAPGFDYPFSYSEAESAIHRDRGRARADSHLTTISETDECATFSDARVSQTLDAGVTRSRAYVLHHDAGAAPVTVITDAEEVVELPPQYHSDSGTLNNTGSVRTSFSTISRAQDVYREKPQPMLPSELEG